MERDRRTRRPAHVTAHYASCPGNTEKLLAPPINRMHERHAPRLVPVNHVPPSTFVLRTARRYFRAGNGRSGTSPPMRERRHNGRETGSKSENVGVTSSPLGRSRFGLSLRNRRRPPFLVQLSRPFSDRRLHQDDHYIPAMIVDTFKPCGAPCQMPGSRARRPETAPAGRAQPVTAGNRLIRMD